MPDSQPVRRWAGLRCQECGREDDGEARGWRAYLGESDDGGEEVLIFCGDCSERELETTSAPDVLWNEQGVAKRLHSSFVPVVCTASR